MKIEITNLKDVKFYCLIRAVRYELKNITLIEYIEVRHLLQSKMVNRESFIEIISYFTDYNKLEELQDFELLKLFDSCMKSISDIKEEEHQEAKTIKKEQEEDNTTIKINIYYLMGKVCKNYNISINELKNYTYQEFRRMYSTCESLEADQFLKLSEIVDNHLFLNSKKTKDKYGIKLKQLRKSYSEYGIKIIKGFDLKGLTALKNQLKGGKNG